MLGKDSSQEKSAITQAVVSPSNGMKKTFDESSIDHLAKFNNNDGDVK